MLAHRVIPVLLKRGSTLIKGERFDSWRSVGHALQAAKVHAARSVDELMILDVQASASAKGPDFFSVAELTEDCFCPLTVGGGVRGADDVRRLLAAGADKVAIGSAALKDPTVIRECASKFGSQAIVAIVDYDEDGNVKRHVSARSWAIEMAYWGAGEILLQAKWLDGTMRGYDLETIGAVASSVSVPVIACGGCSGYRDMAHAIQAGASAVAAGALFQFTDATPRGAAEYLAKAGIEARIPA